MKAIYQTSATAIGGRNGKVKTEDGNLELEVRMPISLGGIGGGYTNPEQLFAAGYAACFDNALNHVAKNQRIAISSKVTAKVGLVQAEFGFDLEVALDVEINGIEEDEAKQLLQTAHAVCPYSRAIRNNVKVELNLV